MNDRSDAMQMKGWIDVKESNYVVFPIQET